jgi:hypothetical protein
LMRTRRWAYGPEGVPKHDWVTPLLDGNEARHLILGMCLEGLRIGKQSSAYSGICDTIPTSASGTPRLLLWLFMDFRMQIFPDVSLIGSPLLGLASSWVLLLCLGLLVNNRVLLNPLPRQSMWLQLVVALNSFGSDTPWATLVRSIPMSHFNVMTLVS